MRNAGALHLRLADYVLWRKSLGSTTDLRANGDDTGLSAGIIVQADYDVLRNNFGNTPPAAGTGTSVAPEVVVASAPASVPDLVDSSKSLAPSYVGALPPGNLINVNGTLYFTAKNENSRIELWKSDGTETGTVYVSDIGPPATESYWIDYQTIGGKLFFAAEGGVYGRELFVLP